MKKHCKIKENKLKLTTLAFTLIELLAIIVILAIIAVITIPIILNVIENSRKGAAIDSAYGYKDAVNKYYVSQMLDNPDLKLSGDYKIKKEGKLEDESGKEHSVAISGIAPSNGWITIENNEIIGGCLMINDYKVELTDKEAIATKGECGEKTKLYKKYENGDVVYFNPVYGYECYNEYEETQSNNEVNEGCMKWNAFLDSEDSATVNLLLDHNTTSKVEWNSSGSNENGPKEVIDALDRDTIKWDGVEILTDKDNYAPETVTEAQHITFSGKKARLISAEEIAKIGKNTDWSIDLDDSIGTVDWIRAVDSFWTTTPFVNATNNFAWGIFEHSDFTWYQVDNLYGVRPVITVSKSLLQK